MFYSLRFLFQLAAMLRTGIDVFPGSKKWKKKFFGGSGRNQGYNYKDYL